MQVFLLYLISILMLLFTVTIHELGHFAAGSIFKVNVKEVSIGVGPILYRKTTKSGTRVSLKLIPFMAYVLFDSKQLRAIYQEEYDDEDYSWYMSRVPKGKKLLEDTKTWQYVIILLAGITINFLAFFIIWPLCWLAFYLNGYSLVNPFIALGESLRAIAYCMVFKGGAGSNIFVEIPDVANNPHWGLIFFDLLLLMNLVTAVFNLLPIPPLDGWKVTAKIYEDTTHKQISERVENILSLIGAGLLVYIFVASILVRWVYW